MRPNVNVIVGGVSNADFPRIYKTKFVNPKLPFGAQLDEPNTKYVIKHNFDLDGETITVPEYCILEFDGGSLDNGTIIGQDTLFINVGDVKIWGENLVREGTWREKNNPQIPTPSSTAKVMWYMLDNESNNRDNSTDYCMRYAGSKGMLSLVGLDNVYFEQTVKDLEPIFNKKYIIGVKFQWYNEDGSWVQTDDYVNLNTSDGTFQIPNEAKGGYATFNLTLTSHQAAIFQEVVEAAEIYSNLVGESRLVYNENAPTKRDADDERYKDSLYIPDTLITRLGYSKWRIGDSAYPDHENDVWEEQIAGELSDYIIDLGKFTKDIGKYNAIVVEGDDTYNSWFTFVTKYPEHVGEYVQQSSVYGTAMKHVYVYAKHTITRIIPSDAKYLVVSWRHGDASHLSPTQGYLHPKSIRFINTDVNAGALSYAKRLNDSLTTLSYPILADSVNRQTNRLNEIRICSWNIGHWSMGTVPYSTITAEEEEQKKNELYNLCYGTLGNPEIFLFNEYESKFSPSYSTSSVMDYRMQWNYYKDRYCCMAMFSNVFFQLLNVVYFPYSQYLVNDVYTDAMDYFCVYRTYLNDHSITIASVHLRSSSDVINLRQCRYIIDYLKGYSHVLILGDFNRENMSVFEEAGYTVKITDTTYKNYDTEATASLDHFVYRGAVSISLESVVVTNLSDHYPIIATLTTTDNRKLKGTSDERPTNVEEGYQYFDTTLNELIYWNGSEWKSVSSSGAEEADIREVKAMISDERAARQNADRDLATSIGTVNSIASNNKNNITEISRQVSEVKSGLSQETSTRLAKDVEHDGKISSLESAVANRYTKNETYNRNEVNAIISSTPESNTVVLPALPETGQLNTLYRIPGPQNTSYSEYGWDGTQFILLDTKDYGIDTDPVGGSMNTITSDAVARSLSVLHPKNSSADLSIQDEDGNTIMELNEGHIKTKEFDSRDALKKDVRGSEGSPDFSVSDEAGNDVMVVDEGHVMTKNFDSRDTIVIKNLVNTVDYIKNWLITGAVYEGRYDFTLFDGGFSVKKNETGPGHNRVIDLRGDMFPVKITLYYEYDGTTVIPIYDAFHPDLTVWGEDVTSENIIGSILPGSGYLEINTDHIDRPYVGIYCNGLDVGATLRVTNTHVISKTAASQVDRDYASIYSEKVNEISKAYYSLSEAGRIGYIFITDLHFNWNMENNHALLRQLQAVVDVANSCQIDFVCVGGDVVDGTTARAQEDMVADYIRQMMKILSACKCPVVILDGNHDDNNYHSEGYGTTDKGFWAKSMLVDNSIIPNMVIGGSSPNNCYYYFEIPKKNLRVVCLDYMDYNENYGKSGKSWWGFSREQVTWLCNTALNTDKNIIILSHGQIVDIRYGFWDLEDEGDKNWTEGVSNKINNDVPAPNGYTHAYYPGYTTDVKNAVLAFNSKSSITLYDNTYDFSNRKGKIILSHHGHFHGDLELNIGNMPVILTCCAKNEPGDTYWAAYRVPGKDDTYMIPNVSEAVQHHANGYGYEFVDPNNRNLGTINECLFDVVSVNSNTINILRMGAGFNRTINR